MVAEVLMFVRSGAKPQAQKLSVSGPILLIMRVDTFWKVILSFRYASIVRTL